MLLDIFITLLLVFANGFFVAAEFAIVKVRASQIELRAREGSRMAKLAKHIVHKLDSYLSATQLGITLASLGLGWVGEGVVARIVISVIHALGFEMDEDTAHKIALPIAFSLITVLHIVFGELAPKSLAIRSPETTTLSIALPLQIFYIVFKPFIWILNGLANFLLGLIGIKDVHGHEVHSPQELLYILEQSKTSGTIRNSEHQILENVFDFYDRPARQIMVPRTRIAAVDVSEKNNKVIEKVIEEGYSRLPVYKDSVDNIVGIIHAKDLLSALYNNKLDTISLLMRPVYFIPETKKIGGLLRDFQQQHAQMAIIVDEFGGTSGLITLEDIIEELVGEIQDEYDNETPWIEKISETEYIANARANIIDANEQLPVPLPEGEEYETVGGYINLLFGKIPSLNEKVSTPDYQFIILDKSEKSIERVKILYLKPLEE
ncbi:MAG: hemolysin family protein [Bacteroidia bacterium]